MKIYVAGPSKELPRIVALRDKLVAAGHVVTSRWIDIILAEGSEHAATSRITEERLMECAAINEADILEAEMMVYVVEWNGGKSVGAGYELGFQARTNRERIVVLQEARTFDPGKASEHVVIPKPTLFALALHRVDSVDKLLAYLEGWESSAKTHVEALEF